MTFWTELEATESARRDEWLDVKPELCLECNAVKRGVLFGSCVDCFNAWRESHGDAAGQAR